MLQNPPRPPAWVLKVWKDSNSILDSSSVQSLLHDLGQSSITNGLLGSSGLGLSIARILLANRLLALGRPHRRVSYACTDLYLVGFSRCLHANYLSWVSIDVRTVPTSLEDDRHIQELNSLYSNTICA